MEFTFDNVQNDITEFGVILKTEEGQSIQGLQVEETVKDALVDMVKTTYESMIALSDIPQIFDPSQKYSASEYLSFPLDDPASMFYYEIDSATNLPTAMNALDDPTLVYCYYTRITDFNNRKITAIRRASQFKGILNRKMLRLTRDNLQLLTDKVFKLDTDFDVLINNGSILIYHPTGFEAIGSLQNQILEAVPHNIALIRQAIQYVEFQNIEEYAKKHPRAAKYLSSIKTLGEMTCIDRHALVDLCNLTAVDIDDSGTQLRVNDHSVLGFLEVLDRRRYCISLNPNDPEKYIAPNRNKIR